jgi:flagellar motor switch protein FliM
VSSKQRVSASHERTVVVRAPFAEGREWRPLSLSGLEKVSKAEILLEERLGWLLAGVGANGQVPAEAFARLKQLFEEDFAVRMDAVQTVPPGKLSRHLTPPHVLGSLSLGPDQTQGLIELELSLAHAIVDLLLGGAGDMVALRPLTEVEHGVLSFVLVEVFRSLSPYVSPALARVRLLDLPADMEATLAGLGKERHVVVALLRVTVGHHAGNVRLVLPGSLVQKAPPPGSGPEYRERMVARSLKHVGRLAGVTSVPLRVELGSFELEAEDFHDLFRGEELGRVVLLPEGTLAFRPDRGEPGAARLRTGPGRAGYVEAKVELHGQRYRATITQIVAGDLPQPQAAGAARQEGQAVEHAKGEGAVILKDIPQSITVELGRVNLTAEEVVSLHLGQVLELNRMPNEQVQLSVSGVIVARGELVESDGQVGVRIVQLVR